MRGLIVFINSHGRTVASPSGSTEAILYTRKLGYLPVVISEVPRGDMHYLWRKVSDINYRKGYILREMGEEP